MSKNNSPHNDLFTIIMQNKLAAKELLADNLPKKICSMVDLKNLQLKPDTYVDEALRTRVTDLVFSTTFNGQPGYIAILVEHQSKPEKLMPHRINKYISSIMDAHMKETGKEELCIVYPMIYYAGNKPWNYSTDIFSLFNENEDLAREIMYQPVKLIDLNKISDEELRKHLYSGFLGYALKNIRKKKTQDLLAGIMDWLKKLEQQQNGDMLISAFFTYMVHVKEEHANINKLKQIIADGLSEKTTREFMTIADRLIADGIERGMERGIEQGIGKGIHEGKQQVAKNLLRENYPLEKVAAITGLPLQEVKEIS